MRTIQRTIAVIVQGVLCIVLLGFLAVIALPRLTSFDVLIVRGGSMEPAVGVGSVIIIDRDARDPVVGDIVSFREANGSIITHRVVAADAGTYETKGDANDVADLERRDRPRTSSAPASPRSRTWAMPSTCFASRRRSCCSCSAPADTSSWANSGRSPRKSVA